MISPYGSEFLSPGDTIVGTRAIGLMDGVARVIPKTDSIMSRMDSISIALQTLATDPSWLSAIESLSETMKQLQASSNSLKMVMSNLESDLPSISNNLADIDVHSTFNTIDSTVVNLKHLSDNLNSTDNSLGMLLNGTQLHDSISSTLNSATKLLQDIREDPEKYLSVRVRLF